MTKDKDELYLVDGSGFIFRAYFALPQNLTNPRGEPVGAVLGFCNMLHKMLGDFHAPYIAVIFDAARQNYRNDIYPDYKANRDEPPADLVPQFPMFRKAAEAFGIPALEVEGYEADDLIATYAKQAVARGMKVTIVGSDKDMYQLIGEDVQMFDPIKQKYIGAAEVVEKFGVAPDKVIEVQALMGDSIDNIPGVKGIGPKTAAELIQAYGTLDNLLNHLSDIKQQKRREMLEAGAENARMSRRLVMLRDDVPVPLSLEDLKPRSQDAAPLVDFLREQGFNTLLGRMRLTSERLSPPTPPPAGGNSSNSPSLRAGGNPSNSPPRARGGILQTHPPAGGGVGGGDFARPDWESGEEMPPPGQNEYILINDENILKQWIAEACETGFICIDTETTALTPAIAELVGISLAIKPGRAAYIPLGHTQAADLLGGGADMIAQLPKARVMDLLKPLLEDESVLKIAHNMKYDWQMFAREGISVYPCDDTMLMSYVLDGAAHSHGMDSLANLHLGWQTIKYEDVAGKGKNQVTFDYVPVEKALAYAAEDADITLRLHKILKPRLAREKMTALYETIERPLIPVIARMELDGICVDPKILKKMSQDFAAQLENLEKDIHRLAGGPFNIASPKQVADILFARLGLQGAKKTKTGDWSTSADILEKLAGQGHEIVQKILAHRQLSKLKSTYTDALQGQINPRTGRVHTSFAMAHTSTGRLASSDPNLQNIPIRSEEGRKIREAFVPAQGCVLLSADYSQVELRLCAAMADVPALKQAFIQGDDIHTITAAQVFGLNRADVTPDLRRQAKAVNFGIIYGISGFGLAKQLGTDNATAAEFIRRYMARFPEIQNYMESKKEEAHRDGYVRTLYGRKIILRGINDKNPSLRMAVERQAINAPLQGTAADIMKLAMAHVARALTEAGLRAKMLLQVHDELVFEVPVEEAEATKTLVCNVMASVADLGVTLGVEAFLGSSWGKTH